VRILHVDPERGWGGGEAQVTALVRELDRRGHESRLAAVAASPIALAAEAAGAVLTDCPIRHDFDVRAVPTLRRLARGVDVVHLHTARAHALAPWLRGAARRLVVTRRMDYVPRGGPWARYLYNHAVDRVIAISDGVRSVLLAAGVEPARIRVVRSGVDVEALAPTSGAHARVRHEWLVAEDEILIVVVGVLEPRKGHAVLLDAATRLSPGLRARYTFCGSGSLEAVLRAEAAARHVPVVFAGFRTDVAACLAAADVVVLPSLHEGLGVAALEAMGAGRPLVASRVGGLAEVVVDGTTGLLVPPGDADALARALAMLAGDATARARLGDAGAAHVRRHYSAAAMADGTLACYTETP
jgi:glycosyltransferase involved in cell wall biosynthesis